MNLRDTIRARLAYENRYPEGTWDQLAAYEQEQWLDVGKLNGNGEHLIERCGELIDLLEAWA